MGSIKNHCSNKISQHERNSTPPSSYRDYNQPGNTYWSKRNGSLFPSNVVDLHNLNVSILGSDEWHLDHEMYQWNQLYRQFQILINFLNATILDLKLLLVFYFFNKSGYSNISAKASENVYRFTLSTKSRLYPQTK